MHLFVVLVCIIQITALLVNLVCCVCLCLCAKTGSLCSVVQCCPVVLCDSLACSVLVVLYNIMSIVVIKFVVIVIIINQTSLVYITV